MEQLSQNLSEIRRRFETLEQLQAERDLDCHSELIEEKNALREENRKLEKKVESLIAKLTELERQNGKDVSIEAKSKAAYSASGDACVTCPIKPKSDDPSKLTKQVKESCDGAKGAQDRNKRGKSTAKSEACGDGQVDVSRLDFRIGRIITAKKHPDADSLYVEDVDVGEGKNRTVVSGLVKFVPLEEMQNRLCVLLCNLKPAKMRGVTSEAMVMCASTPEKVEILIPPENAVPGERVIVEKYSGSPDAQLNPKKKIWETVAPSLKTNDQLLACYEGEPLIVPGKGPIRAPSLKNVQVK